MTRSSDMARVRLSDPAFMEEFVEFLARSGFVVSADGPDTVGLALPLTPGLARTQADIDVLLGVWLELALRIWNDLRPGAGALALAEGAVAADARGLLAS